MNIFNYSLATPNHKVKLLFSTLIIVFSSTTLIFGQVMFDSIKTITNGSWPLYKEAQDKELDRVINPKDSITILGYDVDRFYVRTRYYSKLRHTYIKGYITIYSVDGYDSIKDLVTKYGVKKLKEFELKRQKVLKELTAKFGSKNATRIINQEYWIGMTKEMAILSLGNPDDINRTVTANSTHEQWVYGRWLNLYFENGKVTSFQD